MDKRLRFAMYAIIMCLLIGCIAYLSMQRNIANKTSPSYQISAHRGIAHAVCHSTDGTMLASGGIDGKVLFYDSQHMIKRGELNINEPALNIKWSFDDRYVAIRTYCSIYIWDVASRILTKSIDLAVDIGTGIAFGPTTNEIIAQSDDTLLVFNIDRPNLQRRISPNAGNISCFDVSSDGSCIVTVNQKAHVCIWNSITHKLQLSKKLTIKEIIDIKYINNNTLAMLGDDNSINILDVLSGEVCTSLCTRSASNLRRLYVLRGTNVIAAIGGDTTNPLTSFSKGGCIHIWSADDVNAKWTYQAKSSAVADLSISNLDKSIVVTLYNGMLYKWNSETLSQLLPN